MKLETYLKKNFQDVSVIGVTNPSLIVNHDGNHYVIYRQSGHIKKFVLCSGVYRYEFDEPN